MDEKASTTIGFFCRARAFFTAHGITRLVRVVTDNGANYRARTFTTTITSLASRHQRIRPYTPRHNGKVERYNRILAEECLYARNYSSQQQRHDAVAAPTRRPAAQKSRTLSTWDDFETAFRMWSRPVTL